MSKEISYKDIFKEVSNNNKMKEVSKELNNTPSLCNYYLHSNDTTPLSKRIDNTPNSQNKDLNKLGSSSNSNHSKKYDKYLSSSKSKKTPIKYTKSQFNKIDDNIYMNKNFEKKNLMNLFNETNNLDWNYIGGLNQEKKNKDQVDLKNIKIKEENLNFIKYNNFYNNLIIENQNHCPIKNNNDPKLYEIQNINNIQYLNNSSNNLDSDKNLDNNNRNFSSFSFDITKHFFSPPKHKEHSEINNQNIVNNHSILCKNPFLQDQLSINKKLNIECLSPKFMSDNKPISGNPTTASNHKNSCCSNISYSTNENNPKKSSKKRTRHSPNHEDIIPRKSSPKLVNKSNSLKKSKNSNANFSNKTNSVSKKSNCTKIYLQNHISKILKNNLFLNNLNFCTSFLKNKARSLSKRGSDSKDKSKLDNKIIISKKRPSSLKLINNKKNTQFDIIQKIKNKKKSIMQSVNALNSTYKDIKIKHEPNSNNISNSNLAKKMIEENSYKSSSNNQTNSATITITSDSKNDTIKSKPEEKSKMVVIKNFSKYKKKSTLIQSNYNLSSIKKHVNK